MKQAVVYGNGVATNLEVLDGVPEEDRVAGVDFDT
jgi:hypothetical protein